jgi:hypothetical protein
VWVAILAASAAIVGLVVFPWLGTRLRLLEAQAAVRAAEPEVAVELDRGTYGVIGQLVGATFFISPSGQERLMIVSQDVGPSLRATAYRPATLWSPPELSDFRSVALPLPIAGPPQRRGGSTMLIPLAGQGRTGSASVRLAAGERLVLDVGLDPPAGPTLGSTMK